MRARILSASLFLPESARGPRHPVTRPGPLRSRGPGAFVHFRPLDRTMFGTFAKHVRNMVADSQGKYRSSSGTVASSTQQKRTSWRTLPSTRIAITIVCDVTLDTIVLHSFLQACAFPDGKPQLGSPRSRIL